MILFSDVFIIIITDIKSELEGDESDAQEYPQIIAFMNLLYRVHYLSILVLFFYLITHCC